MCWVCGSTEKKKRSFPWHHYHSHSGHHYDSNPFKPIYKMTFLPLLKMGHGSIVKIQHSKVKKLSYWSIRLPQQDSLSLVNTPEEQRVQEQHLRWYSIVKAETDWNIYRWVWPFIMKVPPLK